jgi:hypothetical protein
LEHFDVFPSFLVDCTLTLSSGQSHPSTGAPLVLRDGDVVKTLVQAGNSGALAHITDVPPAQMEPLDGKKGVLKSYKSLSAESKKLTR